VSRKVIRGFTAWDIESQSTIALQPGDPIEGRRIHRSIRINDADEIGVYAMEFESGGRLLRCSLVHFQARTAATPQKAANENPAREAAAVV